MGIALEREIEKIIVETVEGLGRPDLFRRPLVSFSAAEDEGYAKLKTMIGDWHQSPPELLPGAQSVISYFVPFTKEVVSAPKGAAQASPLWAETYLQINRHFEVVNAAVAGFLKGLGYAAKTIKATHTYDPKDLKSMWSHRSAAAIAGLGAFGTNRLLITEKGCGGQVLHGDYHGATGGKHNAGGEQMPACAERLLQVMRKNLPGEGTGHWLHG